LKNNTRSASVLMRHGYVRKFDFFFNFEKHP
jgi:hypothetical protein